jgi:hypothetical protein
MASLSQAQSHSLQQIDIIPNYHLHPHIQYSINHHKNTKISPPPKKKEISFLTLSFASKAWLFSPQVRRHAHLFTPHACMYALLLSPQVCIQCTLVHYIVAHTCVTVSNTVAHICTTMVQIGTHICKAVFRTCAHPMHACFPK